MLKNIAYDPVKDFTPLMFDIECGKNNFNQYADIDVGLVSAPDKVGCLEVCKSVLALAA